MTYEIATYQVLKKNDKHDRVLLTCYAKVKKRKENNVIMSLKKIIHLKSLIFNFQSMCILSKKIL